MKTILGGVALVALIGVASPGWAQTPMSPSTPMVQPKSPPAAAPQNDAAASAGAASSTTAPNAAAGSANGTAVATQTRPRRKRTVHTVVHGYPRGGYAGPPSDHVADQLNSAELQRGGPPADVGPGDGPGPGYGGGYPPPGYGGPGFPPPPPPWAFAPPPPHWGGYPPPPWAYRPY